jgi:Effector protein
MHKNFILVIAMLVSASVFAQHEPLQPFEDLGIKVKVLTLSNGKYDESFPNDTVFRFGTVMFNRVTGEVVTVVENDTLHGEYTLKAEVTSRWLSPDPLGAKFPNWSPYNYAVNNPVLFIDPDGQEIRVYFGNESNQYVVFNYDKDGKGAFTNSDGSAYDGKNDFLNNAMTAFNSLSESDKGREVISNLAGAPASEFTLKVHRGEGNGGVFSFGMYDNENTGQIPWNPTAGVQDAKSGNKQNPAMVLFHEMDHANGAYEKYKEEKANGQETTPFAAWGRMDRTPDPEFDNAEEKRVIRGNEAQVARDLNQKHPGKGFQEFQSHHGTWIKTTGPVNVNQPKKKN